MRNLFLCLAFSTSLLSLQAGTLDESKIRATLRGGVTTIALPVNNSSGQPAAATLQLEWLDTADKPSQAQDRQITLPPGQTTIETPLPLTDPSIWTRLRYRLTPAASAIRSLTPAAGTVSLALIADHVFELSAAFAGTPQRGQPITVHAQALHPATRKPIHSLQWKALLNGGKTIEPRSIVEKQPGFVEVTFDLPASRDPQEPEIQIQATNGDFHQFVSLDVQFRDQPSARIQTDKPIYQPGQTLHLRAVVFDSLNRALKGAPVSLRVTEASSGDRVHTANFTTGNFGIIKDDWNIPSSAELSFYHIELRDANDNTFARHSIRISRYDLPTFKVEAKPDRGAYLPNQPIQVTVTASYLFGKPVPGARIRIVQSSDAAKEQPLTEARTGANGSFTATLKIDTSEFLATHERFQDIQCAAYVTDPVSGRTEQRRFDVRLTREAVHVYLVAEVPNGPDAVAVYVSTSNADGTPVSADVTLTGGALTTRLRTNGYGIGKAILRAAGDGYHPTLLTATTLDGRTGTHRETTFLKSTSRLTIESAHIIHRVGETVTLRLTAPADSPAGQTVAVHALVDDRSVAHQVVRLVDRKATVQFPYHPAFRRTVAFEAWTTADPRVDFRYFSPGARAVIFPDTTDLRLTASTSRPTYKPGENATLQLQVASRNYKPVEAAIGVAVVDQSVIERAQTDNDFGQGRWFSCLFCPNNPDQRSIGGVTLSDLYQIKPGSPITPELELVAEALLAYSSGLIIHTSGERLLEAPEFKRIKQDMNKIEESLDRSYTATLQFPDTFPTFAAAAGNAWSNIVDPWHRTYQVDFSVDGPNRTIRIRSAGPDKQFGTADDFEAARFQRSYVAPLQLLITEALRKAEDFPATVDELGDVLKQHGLLLSSLRDHWGTPYRPTVTTPLNFRSILIVSAGPDREFDTADDFSLLDQFGPYFRREGKEISAILRKAPTPPKTVEEFSRLIDITRYRDAWGRPYRIASYVSSSYSDRITTQTVTTYGKTPRIKTEVTPVTRKTVTFSLDSAGPDGIVGSNDDFAIAGFPFALEERTAEAQHAGPPIRLAAGTGAIRGVVRDSSGAPVPNVNINVAIVPALSDHGVTDNSGVFLFQSIAPGLYAVTAMAPGFQTNHVTQVPVRSGETTQLELTLQIGSMAETLLVDAKPAQVNTATMSLAAEPVSTPRVRDYFPETLLWLPELITNSQGVARHEFKLADTITTWKIAAFASTTDGRTAELESSIRTFQPFFLELDPPQILTEGDRIDLPVTIRNYTAQVATVSSTLQPNPAWSIEGPASSKAEVDPSNAANLAYSIRAKGPAAAAPIRVSATTTGFNDAIEKPVRIHPNGREVRAITGDLLTSTRATLRFDIPPAAIPGTSRAELRIYPNFSSLLLESAASLLDLPHACAEQSISAGFANLIALRYARQTGIATSAFEQRTIANVRAAVDTASALRHGTGGISYWPNGEEDIALTAHTLHFLVAASSLVTVASENIGSLASWLEKHQTKDGRWLAPANRESSRASTLLTSTVVRALAAARKAKAPVSQAVLNATYHHLAQFTDQTDEPYLLANLLLAALDSGDESVPGNAVPRLLALAKEERGTLFWNLQTNSPFYGWGTAGRYETTGLVVTALSAWRAKHQNEPNLDLPIRKGLLFLLRGRDPARAWNSTQSTLQAIQALGSAIHLQPRPSAATVDVLVNGKRVRTVSMPAGQAEPNFINISAHLTSAANEITLIPTQGTVGAAIQLASSHWLPWTAPAQQPSPELQFKVEFDRLMPRPGQPVRCTVDAERVGFRGHGMLIAEVGLPPGAQVDRASLESVLENGKLGVDRYEVLPDRVLFYLWPKAGGSHFDFYFTHRFPIEAQSAPSLLYDYYNPEAAIQLPPSHWQTR